MVRGSWFLGGREEYSWWAKETRKIEAFMCVSVAG